MANNSDIELINKLVAFCKDRNFTIDQIASFVGMTRGWASLITNGKIKSLKFSTRSRIEKALGI